MLLTLLAKSNENFPAGSHQREVLVAAEVVELGSLDEAREVVRRFILEHDLGGGNDPSQAGRVTVDGGPLRRLPYCFVSYTGRFWKLDEVGREMYQEIDEFGRRNVREYLPATSQAQLNQLNHLSAGALSPNRMPVDFLPTETPSMDERSPQRRSNSC